MAAVAFPARSTLSAPSKTWRANASVSNFSSSSDLRPSLPLTDSHLQQTCPLGFPDLLVAACLPPHLAIASPRRPSSSALFSLMPIPWIKAHIRQWYATRGLGPSSSSARCAPPRETWFDPGSLASRLGAHAKLWPHLSHIPMTLDHDGYEKLATYRGNIRILPQHAMGNIDPASPPSCDGQDPNSASFAYLKEWFDCLDTFVHDSDLGNCPIGPGSLEKTGAEDRAVRCHPS